MRVSSVARGREKRGPVLRLLREYHLEAPLAEAAARAEKAQRVRIDRSFVEKSKEDFTGSLSWRGSP